VTANGETPGEDLAAPAIDAAASILIGRVLMLEAVLLGVDCWGLVTGESVGPLLLAETRRIVSLCEGGVSARALQTLQLGPDVQGS
jgi:hypothetical protein